MQPRNRVPTHPGEILLEEFLRPLGHTQVALAEHVGVPVQRINEIVRGKRGITPETAWLFAEAFGTSPEPRGGLPVRSVEPARYPGAMKIFTAILLLALAAPAAASDDPRHVEVYRSPTCGCCIKWVRHLESAGFTVAVKDVRDVRPVKVEHGVPAILGSCHTALVDGYVVEGHVPASDLKRLLAERPKVLGLAVPGMPIGSPGMEGPNAERYRVMSFDAAGKIETYSSHGP